MNLELYNAPILRRDMSHFGRFLIAGADAAALLHHLTTADIKGLKTGAASEAVLISNKARILDWLTIVRLENARFLVVTSPNRSEMFAPHARQFILFRQDVKIEADSTPLSGVFGSDAQKPENGWPTARLPNGGFLLRGENSIPAPLCDDQTFNVLRVEAGLPVTGLELTDEINPWEANFDYAISLSKGCYNGQEIVARLNTYQKIKQRLRGLKLEKLLESGRVALTKDGKNTGFLSSSVESPRFGAIGLGFVRGDFAQPNTILDAGGTAATVVALPFGKEQINE